MGTLGVGTLGGLKCGLSQVGTLVLGLCPDFVDSPPVVAHRRSPCTRYTHSAGPGAEERGGAQPCDASHAGFDHAKFGFWIAHVNFWFTVITKENVFWFQVTKVHTVRYFCYFQ